METIVVIETSNNVLSRTIFDNKEKIIIIENDNYISKSIKDIIIQLYIYCFT